MQLRREPPDWQVNGKRVDNIQISLNDKVQLESNGSCLVAKCMAAILHVSEGDNSGGQLSLVYNYKCNGDLHFWKLI